MSNTKNFPIILIVVSIPIITFIALRLYDWQVPIQIFPTHEAVSYFTYSGDVPLMATGLLGFELNLGNIDPMEEKTYTYSFKNLPNRRAWFVMHPRKKDGSPVPLSDITDMNSIISARLTEDAKELFYIEDYISADRIHNDKKVHGYWKVGGSIKESVVFGKFFASTKSSRFQPKKGSNYKLTISVTPGTKSDYSSLDLRIKLRDIRM